MQNAELKISFPFSVLIPLRGLFTAPSRHSLQAASALDLIAAVRFPLLSLTSKSSMMRLFLCDAKRQIRSIVNLCEEFGD